MQHPFVRTLAAHGVLRMDGRDALDLLHRMSTNAVADMRQGEVRETLLTTEKARIIDAVLVLAREDHVLLLVSPGRAATVRAWLEKYTIMEDIRYSDTGSRFAQYEAAQLGEEDGERVFGGGTLDDWTWRDIRFGAREGTLLRHASVQGPGWRLLLSNVDGDASQQERDVIAMFSSNGIPPISAHDYEYWRISHSFPAVGTELTERVHPLEAGAEGAVSFTKGCYIGQEVIARLDSYDKVQRRLRRLRIEASAQLEGLAGSDLEKDGANAGFITSAIPDTEGGTFLALGCVRTAFLAAGTALHVNRGEQKHLVTVLDAGGAR